MAQHFLSSEPEAIKSEFCGRNPYLNLPLHSIVLDNYKVEERNISCLWNEALPAHIVPLCLFVFVCLFFSRIYCVCHVLEMSREVSGGGKGSTRLNKVQTTVLYTVVTY